MSLFDGTVFGFLTLEFAVGTVMFNQRVHFRTDQDDQSQNIEPKHQNDHRPDTPVWRVVISEIGDIGLKNHGNENQHDGSKDASGRDVFEFLLDVRSEIKNQGQRQG